MRKQIAIIVVFMLTTGFLGFGNRKSDEMKKTEAIQSIRETAADGQFFKAVQMSEKLNKRYPNDLAVISLKFEIQEAQARRHSELMQSGGPRPQDDFEKNSRDDVQTLLERAEAHFQAGRFSEASENAQKVFQLDPDNGQASRLLDRVARKLLDHNNTERAAITQVAREEVTKRIEQYRDRAKAAIEKEHWGEARFALQKVLILSPSDPEALRLYDLIESNTEPKAA